MEKRERIDILVVIGKMGGVEGVVNQTALYLKKTGYTVRVVQLLKGDLSWIDERLERHLVSEKESGEDFEDVINEFVEFYRSTGVPDLVLATTAPFLCGMVKIAQLECGGRFRIGSWLHCDVDTYEEWGLGGIEELKAADFHLAINAKIYRQLCIKADLPRVFRVTNPLNSDKVSYAEQRKKETFAYVGRLDQPKNVAEIVKAIGRMRTDASLLIAGDGPERTNIEKLAERLGVSDRVCVFGWCDNPWERIREAGCFVFASELEASPLVVPEALASGIPVLSANVGDVADWVTDGTNGWIFESGDFDRMADFMEEIASGKRKLPSARQCAESISGHAGERPLRDLAEILERELWT